MCKGRSAEADAVLESDVVVEINPPPGGGRLGGGGRGVDHVCWAELSCQEEEALTDGGSNLGWIKLDLSQDRAPLLQPELSPQWIKLHTQSQNLFLIQRED